LNCPKCTGSLLPQSYGVDITVHRCDVCAGLWCKPEALLNMKQQWMAEAALDVGDPRVGQQLDRVDDTKGPLAEAAFLDHASSVSVNYTDGETDGDGEHDLEFKDYGISGRYVTADAGWIFDLGFERNEPDNPFSAGPDEFEIDTFSVGVGKYLTDTTTLVFSYENKDADEGGDVDTYRADIVHLWQLEKLALKFNGGYGQTDVDDDYGDDIDAWELGATVYPCKGLGIGGGYRNTENNLAEVEQYYARAEWFINDQVGVSLEYQDAEVEDTDLEADAIVFGARLRF